MRKNTVSPPDSRHRFASKNSNFEAKVPAGLPAARGKQVALSGVAGGEGAAGMCPGGGSPVPRAAQHRAARASVLCGEYSSTCRRVLEYLAESTARHPAWRLSGLRGRTAGGTGTKLPPIPVPRRVISQTRHPRPAIGHAWPLPRRRNARQPFRPPRPATARGGARCA